MCPTHDKPIRVSVWDRTSLHFKTTPLISSPVLEQLECKRSPSPQLNHTCRKLVITWREPLICIYHAVLGWINMVAMSTKFLWQTSVRILSALLLLAFHLSLIYLTFPFFTSMSIHHLLVLNSLSAILRSDLSISPTYNAEACDSVQDWPTAFVNMTVVKVTWGQKRSSPFIQGWALKHGNIQRAWTAQIFQNVWIWSQPYSPITPIWYSCL